MKKLIVTIGAGVLAACSSNPQPATTTPQPAPVATAPAPATTAPAASTAPAGTRDLGGVWDFSVDAGGQVVPGEISLTRNGANYSGTISPQGMESATVTSVRITGDRVTMTADTPSGPATFEMTLTADGRAMSGTVAFNGQSMPVNARKR